MLNALSLRKSGISGVANIGRIHLSAPERTQLCRQFVLFCVLTDVVPPAACGQYSTVACLRHALQSL